MEYPSTSDGNSVHSGYERLPLQCHPCLENGDFFITFLFIVHKLAACYADNVVDETFASLFHRFVFKDNAGVEVNPARFVLGEVELVEIFMVGTYVPNGVPRPVVNNTMWHPHEARAVAATRSFPGAESRFRPFTFRRSP